MNGTRVPVLEVGGLLASGVPWSDMHAYYPSVPLPAGTVCTADGCTCGRRRPGPTWADVIGVLNRAGLRLERQPVPFQPNGGHTADWWAAKQFSDGTHVWIRVLLYRTLIADKWQVTAYRTKRDRPARHENRVLLHDPTVAEALGALAVLGLLDAAGAPATQAHPLRKDH
jgi:hypothetical protein